MFHLVICITIGTFCPVQIKKRPCGRPTKKEMTLDCPFRNPLQSRVIPVLSYYITSYGYLRFYWIRSASFPPAILQLFRDHHFVAIITA